MIILGIILVVLGWVVPVPAFVSTIGWLLVAIGVVLWVAGYAGHPVGGRRFWF